MTDQKHPITPPSEMFQAWESDILNELDNVDRVLAIAWKNGFQAGADAELEACKKVILDQGWFASPGFRLDQLHNARRPTKPPRLKEQALATLTFISTVITADQQDIIRQALESLPE